MQRTLSSGIIFGLFLLCCGGILLASEADELRERAQAMQKKASIIAEKGNKQEAEQLEKESAKLLEAAEQLDFKTKWATATGDLPDRDTIVRRLKERLQDLRAKEGKLRGAIAPESELAEMRKHIVHVEHELASLAHHAEWDKVPPEFRPQGKMLEAAIRRLHHLRVAAENLKMADAHDLATQIMEKAEEMEREVGEGKKRWAEVMEKVQGGELKADVVRELKDEIERLRAEVKELRQEVEKR